jgi:hypothetical protein
MAIVSKLENFLGSSLLILALGVCSGCDPSSQFALQPIQDEPGKIELSDTKEIVYYIPSTIDTIKWGYLPNENDSAVLTVDDGAIVVFDTVSHEGLLEDQGRDPLGYFSKKGIPKKYVLQDAVDIATSDIQHDFRLDGPHIVTGPVAISGAQPGDVLKVEVLSLDPRVSYGVISNRHGKGALPGEFPETTPPASDPPLEEY